MTSPDVTRPDQTDSGAVQTQARQPVLPPDQRVGYAVVGLGELTEEQLYPAFSLSGQSRLCALVTGNREKALEQAELLGLKPQDVYDYDHFEELKDRADVQAVFIVLPNSLHREYTERAARIGKHRISFQPRPGEAPRTGQLELRVNGNLAALPPRGLDLGEGSRIARTATGGGLDITAADGTHLIVTPNLWAAQNVWYLNVEVLGTAAREGTMGHILSPDWLPRAPDGSSFGPAPAAGTDRHTLLNRKFADAWRVTASTSLFDYGAGTSSATFTDRNWPPDPGKPCKATIGIQRPPEPLRTEIALRRCSILKDKQAIESYAFDAAAMGDMAVIKAYLQSLTLRAQAIQAGP